MTRRPADRTASSDPGVVKDGVVESIRPVQWHVDDTTVGLFAAFGVLGGRLASNTKPQAHEHDLQRLKVLHVDVRRLVQRQAHKDWEKISIELKKIEWLFNIKWSVKTLQTALQFVSQIPQRKIVRKRWLNFELAAA